MKFIHSHFYYSSVLERIQAKTFQQSVSQTDVRTDGLIAMLNKTSRSLKSSKATYRRRLHNMPINI